MTVCSLGARCSRLLASVVVVVAAACGGESPVQPTPGPGSESGGGPLARLAVTIDSLGSREAVAALSEVAVDATASTGTGLTYRIDFGDGTTAAQPIARHTYARPGTFTVAATATDSSGRSITTSQSVVVASVVGTWTHSGYLPGPRSVEVRTLSLTAQDGTSVRGQVQTEGRTRPVVGTLSGERRIQLVVQDPSETLEGVLPSVVTSEASVLELTALNGPAEGERLGFRPVRGEPSGPPPDAVLKMRFFSFNAPFAVQGYSPILFDGTTSRGEGLRYFIEFGDREVATESSAVHPIATAGSYSARLTVVDAFGRSDQEVRTFQVLTLVDSGIDYWESFNGGFIRLRFHEGANVRGTIRFAPFAPGFSDVGFSGSLSGEGNIQLVMDGSGVALTGTLDLRDDNFVESSRYRSTGRMVLTQSGGAGHGQTYEYYYTDGY